MLIDEISNGLNLPKSYIKNMSLQASFIYKTYQISKRSGGKRTIHHPGKRLKAVQRWLSKYIISEWPVHKAATAYKKNCSVLKNATVHADSNYLLRIDLNKFFPSITDKDILSYSKRHIHRWNDEDIDLFCKMVCRKDQLTIGAPSSPSISNSICFQLDDEISKITNKLSIKYTRYSDDLFFSSIKPNLLQEIPDQVTNILSGLDFPKNLSLNTKKTRHSSKKGCRKVTGLIIGSDGKIYLGRKTKRTIRSLVYTFDELEIENKKYVAGMLSYARSIDPDFINALIIKYGPEKINSVRLFRL